MSTLPLIEVVDVGALPMEGQRDVYQTLIEQALCHVVGFEPNPAGCEALRALYGKTHSFFPYFVGRGGHAVFHVCNAPATSSLYEPNMPLLDQFQKLSEVCQVVERIDVVTRRLDDIEDITRVDFLKLDVQGAELDVIEGASDRLRDVLVIQAEVEFLPLYKDQPLFADVDQALRARGFMFHRLLGWAGRTVKPLLLSATPERPVSQWLWSDAVYVRNVATWESLSPDALLRLATILHEVYKSYDLVVRALHIHDQKLSTDFLSKYVAQLAATNAL